MLTEREKKKYLYQTDLNIETKNLSTKSLSFVFDRSKVPPTITGSYKEQA